MMEVLFLASILFVLCCSLVAVLGQFVLHKCILVRTLILEVLLKFWGEALFYVVFVQVFLERLKCNGHLLHDPILKQLFVLLRNTEVSFHICP